MSVELACVPEAIPGAERAAHFALARRLFTALATGRRDFVDGLAFEFEAAVLGDVARFVANERKCCPFLRFELALEKDTLRLEMRGPQGTREVLVAELGLDGGEPCGCSARGCG